MEKVRAHRTKLRSLGIPVEQISYMLCDNQSVVKSTGNAESTLSKKHDSICWHAIREAMAQGWLRMSWEPTENNLADLLTKSLETGKRNNFIGQISHQHNRLQEPEEGRKEPRRNKRRKDK